MKNNLPIAIGGSAANPATIGHYGLIEWLLNSGKFSQVIWIISGDREDKKNLINADHRLALTLLTFPQDWFLKKDVKFVISFKDMYGKNTPTIDWLREIKKMYPDKKIVWYTGVDSVVPLEKNNNKSDIETWDDGEELFRDWNFLIFPRKGYPDPASLSLPANFEMVNIDVPDASSSMVRKNIMEGKYFEHMMTPKAAEYLKQNGLYEYKDVT